VAQMNVSALPLTASTAAAPDACGGAAVDVIASAHGNTSSRAGRHRNLIT
jgi:hypothetical protein